ncbi:MAG: anthranilate synthase component I family protein [Synechococcaceae cyanobacterium SM2_3_1]|nr:anthranilate synthase component I family protein [Synechococcaceae cyanobacterium SM2_3_1]
MVDLDFQRFLALSQQGNFIPVYQEWVADLDTPVSAWYRVCAGQPYNFLLESVEGGEQIGRYSFLGSDPLWVLEVRGAESLQKFRDGTSLVHRGSPFHILETCLHPFHPVHLPELPSSIGGLFGYWGYELIHWIEPRVPVHPSRPGDPPDGIFMQVDSILLFDQVKRKIWVVAYADLRHVSTEAAYNRAVERIQTLIANLQSPYTPADLGLGWRAASARDLNYQACTDPAQYGQQVEKARDYIKAGDIFQVVLSQEFHTTYSGDPFRLYRSLRQINPSPYMAYLQFEDFYLIGSSPEVMVRLHLQEKQRMAVVRPIAGTRPRGETLTADQQLEADLLADPKERAEHIMLVDLGRNDLGRVCHPGTVQVQDLMTIERYSHVMHIVSHVTGELLPTKTPWDLLQATFPAGTVTGAPKIRAMEIIYELEGLRRGPYSGAYGYYDFSGQLNTAITIRTLWVRDQKVTLRAGAGIVADSDPEREQEECFNKVRGMLTAIASLQPSP